MTRKAIEYDRKSIRPSGIDDEAESIAYQQDACALYCEENDLELVAIFSDIGQSGVNEERPELVEMLNFLETTDEKIDVMLFYSVDRLGRDLRNNLQLVLKITEYVEQIVFRLKSLSLSGICRTKRFDRN